MLDWKTGAQELVILQNVIPQKAFNWKTETQGLVLVMFLISWVSLGQVSHVLRASYPTHT